MRSAVLMAVALQVTAIGLARGQDATLQKCVQEVRCPAGTTDTNCDRIKSLVLSATAAKASTGISLCSALSGTPLKVAIFSKFVQIDVEVKPTLLPKLGLSRISMVFDEKTGKLTPAKDVGAIVVDGAQSFLSYFAQFAVERGLAEFEPGGVVMISLKSGKVGFHLGVARSGASEILSLHQEIEPFRSARAQSIRRMLDESRNRPSP